MNHRLSHILDNLELKYDADRLRIKERKKHRVYAKHRSKLAGFCRTTLRRLEKNDKGKKAEFEKILGYTEHDFKKHIESLFKEGMSWKNRSDWHIDHIKPINAFLKEGCRDIRKINSLDNLQPLWAKDNIIKSDSYF